MLKPTLYVVLLPLLLLSRIFEVATTTTEVTCIDRDADILSSSNFIYAPEANKEACEIEKDCVPHSPLVGGGDEDLAHRGFVVLKGKANLGSQINWFRPSPDTTSEYLYLRYYVHKVPKTPSLFRVYGARGSAALDVTSDGKWKEACFPMKHDGGFDYRSIMVYSGVPDGEEYLALDKLILVAPTDGSTIACSSTEVEEIKGYCQEEFFPPTTTTTTTTTTTSTSSTTTTSTSSTERTSPGTSTKSSTSPPSTTTTTKTEKPTSPTTTTAATSSSTESDEGPITSTTTKKPSKKTSTKIAIYVASVVGFLALALVMHIALKKCRRGAGGSKVNNDVVEAAGPDMKTEDKKETEFTGIHFPVNNGSNYFSNNFKTLQPKFDSVQKV